MDSTEISQRLYDPAEIDFYADGENEDFDFNDFDFSASDLNDQLTMLD